MKGGITSGVVYPHAICELARTYRLRNVGGTSAGAISAAVAAAAEHGRGTDGFVKLAALPDWIGAGTNMLSLFKPQRRTRALFRLLLALMARRRFRLLRVYALALATFPLATLLGAGAGIALVVLAILDGSGPLRWVAVAMGGLFAILGVTLAVALAAVRRFARAVPDNRFGLCSGNGAGALTPWLADEIDRLAGADEPVDEEQPPLTFGGLWAGAAGDGTPEEPQLRLEVMTTNLTNRRPERLPWSTETFFFDPNEFGDLFPERVVRWMIDHPPPEPEHEVERRDWRLRQAFMYPRLPFPPAANLPVIVATRMSLSFPLLLSAVPLWTFDMSRELNQNAFSAWRSWAREQHESWEEEFADPNRRAELEATHGRPEPEVCWFSDGGISSNLPIHFFDTPLPRWPTFAINLRPFHPDHPRSDNDEQNVWMPETNAGGILEWWYRFPARAGRLKLLDGRVGAFGNAVVRTMQNRVDEEQIRLPGYRDRVVHIGHTEHEGGLNLTMEPGDILRLTARGRAAGGLLADRFGGDPDAPQLSWANHRWVRYRSTMAALERLLRSVAIGYLAAPDHPGDAAYASLITRPVSAPPGGYRWERNAQRDYAEEATKRLVAYHQWVESQGERFAEGTPSPPPDARIGPPQ